MKNTGRQAGATKVEEAPGLSFTDRLDPAARRAEDTDTERLVARIQAGEADLFGLLYARYFDRVYSALRVLLKNPHDAEDAVQQVFIQVLAALPRYEQRRLSFQGWLFTIVRNHAIDLLRKSNKLDLVGPEAIERHRDRTADAGSDGINPLSWLRDQDLLLFIERLSIPQRQVLLLRHMLGLSIAETAKVLDRTETDVSTLQTRATTFLRNRLTSIGRGPRHPEKTRMRRVNKPARVLRNRRFALGDQ